MTIGFKQQRSTYRISKAPTGRGRCRRCRKSIAEGSTRLEINCFVRPGRYTLLLRCSETGCIDSRLSAAISSREFRMPSAMSSSRDFPNLSRNALQGLGRSIGMRFLANT